jgi:hypothetical protein
MESASAFSPLPLMLEILSYKCIITPVEIADAVVSALQDPRPALQSTAQELVSYIVKCSAVAAVSSSSSSASNSNSNSAVKQEAQYDPTASVAKPTWHGRVVVHALINSLCSACFDKVWRVKIAGCNGLAQVCKLITWQTARVFEYKILKALLFVMKDHLREVSLAVTYDAQTALYALLTTRYGMPTSASGSSSSVSSSSSSSSSGGGAGSSVKQDTTAAAVKADASAMDVDSSADTKPAVVKPEETAAGGSSTASATAAATSTAAAAGSGDAMNVEAAAAAAAEAAAGSSTKKGVSTLDSVEISDSVVKLLASDLANSRHAVRSVVKRALELLAAAKGVTVTEVLQPCKKLMRDQFLPFPKQLRTLQQSQQIGCLEAVNYALMLVPPLFNVAEGNMLQEHITALVAEVQGIIEADTSDEVGAVGVTPVPAPALYSTLPGYQSSSGSSVQPAFPCRLHIRDMHMPSELPHCVQFRISAIRLMHAVIVSTPSIFSMATAATNSSSSGSNSGAAAAPSSGAMLAASPRTAQLLALKNNCMALFFRSLTSRSDQVVDAARSAVVIGLYFRGVKDKVSYSDEVLKYQCAYMRPVYDCS